MRVPLMTDTPIYDSLVLATLVADANLNDWVPGDFTDIHDRIDVYLNRWRLS
jgi:hypothetical protein